MIPWKKGRAAGAGATHKGRDDWCPECDNIQEDKTWSLQRTARVENSISVSPDPFGADVLNECEGPSFGRPLESFVNVYQCN